MQQKNIFQIFYPKNSKKFVKLIVKKRRKNLLNEFITFTTVLSLNCHLDSFLNSVVQYII
jgi:hypothetical protein